MYNILNKNEKILSHIHTESHIMQNKLSVIGLLLSTLTISTTFANEVVIISIDNITVVINKSSSSESTYLDAINKARASTQDCGKYGKMPPVPALKWNEELTFAAKIHSNDLAESNTFSHTGSGKSSDAVAELDHPGTGSTLKERIEYAGYTEWSYIGENIAAGYNTTQEVIAAWISSPGHCINLMKEEFTEVGMTRVDNTSSKYKSYWTQDFGKR